MSKQHTDLKTKLLKNLPWIVWTLGCLFYFYEMMLQVSPSAMEPELRAAFAGRASALGVLSSVYFYSYSLMQIPGGLLLDYFGPRRLLTWAAAICSIGAFVFSQAHSLIIAEISRFFIGFGSAFAVIGTLKLGANWFPVDRFALLMGILVAIGMLGAIAGESPLAISVIHIGWRETMMVLGFIGIVLTLLIHNIVRDHPPKSLHVKTHTPQQRETARALFSGLLEVISNRQIWLTALYGGLMFSPLLTFASLWGVPFMELKYEISRPAAAWTVSLVFFGMGIGSPLFGWISDRIARRKPTMIVGSIGALICTLAIFYLSFLPLWATNILVFCFGLTVSGFLTAFSIVREISPQHCSATALGFMNLMNSIGTAFYHPIIGYCLDAFWSGQYTNAGRVYTLADYQKSLAILPISIAVALLLLPYIKETYCKIIQPPLPQKKEAPNKSPQEREAPNKSPRPQEKEAPHKSPRPLGGEG